MNQRFTDKVVLVTGGGSGIGRAVARGFAGEGATVVVAGRDVEKLDATVRLIEEAGGKATAARADISGERAVADLVAVAAERHGGLHIAVNNAGIVDAAGPVADIDGEAWARVIATNLTGTWLSMKHEISHMSDNGGGVIVNMSSVVGSRITVPGIGAYASTKAAVSSLTRTAAREYISAGVRINAVSPGPADTPMSLLYGETEADRAARLKNQIPIGRVGMLNEVTSAVLWLASPESGFAVGLDLVIDGGGSA